MKMLVPWFWCMMQGILFPTAVQNVKEDEKFLTLLILLKNIPIINIVVLIMLGTFLDWCLDFDFAIIFKHFNLFKHSFNLFTTCKSYFIIVSNKLCNFSFPLCSVDLSFSHLFICRIMSLLWNMENVSCTLDKRSKQKYG